MKTIKKHSVILDRTPIISEEIACLTGVGHQNPKRLDPGQARMTDSANTTTISFVIPVYNEEKRLPKTFKALRAFKAPRGLTLQNIIFVNDGSTDKTAALIKQFSNSVILGSERTSAHQNPKRIDPGQARMTTKKPSQIKVISYKKNQGKGYAIKKGMLASTSDYTLFFDADMSTPLSELSKFMPFIKNNVDVIIGTRKNGHSTVLKHQPFLRNRLGRVFTKLTNITLNTWVTDFTCGFKAFSKQSKDEIFKKAVINRWGYDAELIFLARILNYSMAEKAVTWANDEGTKVSLLKAVPQTLEELAQIRWTHTIKPTLNNVILIPSLLREKPPRKVNSVMRTFYKTAKALNVSMVTMVKSHIF